MDKKILTRSYLETLSSSDLVSLADDYGIDIPDNLSRRFIIGELLEIAEGEGITPLLSAKLRDLAAICRAFKRRLGEGRVTAEEMLPRLLRLLPYSDTARGACLYFDGFTGFTSVQYRLITELIRRSRESLFVFTLPKKEAAAKGEPGKADLFGMSIAAMKRITRCAADAGTALGGSFFAGTHRPALVKHDDFKFLEENLMRFSKESFP